MDVSLHKRVDPKIVLERLKQVVAPGFKVMSVEEVNMKAPALMAAVTGMDYIMYVPENASSLQVKIDELLAQDEVLVTRKRKQKKRKGRRDTGVLPGPTTRQIDMRPTLVLCHSMCRRPCRKTTG